MTLLLLYRPTSRNGGIPVTGVGGHFIPEGADKSSIQIFKLGKKSLKKKPQELPVIEELEPPKEIEVKLSQFDLDTRQNIVREGRKRVLASQVKELEINKQLIALTNEVNRLIVQFEDEALLLLLLD